MLSASCCCPDGFLSTREFCKINEVLAIRETPSWDHWDHEGSFKNVWMKPSAMNLIQTMGTPGTPWSIRWLKKGAKMVRNIQWAPGRCGVNGYASVFRGELGLPRGKAGDLMKIHESFMLFPDMLNMSE
ncbi:unnamed protein product [Toxocara canis]|uniref:Zf-RVT domain-containing protein n=1 Tax=Toxocara canis TaxID=6265 RepID=A0A183U2D8_TOXCA|nr:unnamed protein product [Toxocara canis]